jgi:polyvinyl alcohol dehydrogenase (cytochrome)
MRFVVSAAVVVLFLLSGAPAASADRESKDWPSAGQNISNTHAAAPDENRINAGNVSGLTPRWTFTTLPTLTNVISTNTSDVSATPTVADDTVYFPDWGGWLYAVDAHTGKTRWVRKISDYNGVAGSFSRVSPAIVGDLLILGDKPPSGVTGWGLGGTVGAHIFAVNRFTGAPVWTTQVDKTPVSQITASPVVFDGKVYVGISSVEEVTAAFVPNYQCCIFRGSEVALDAHTGKMLWQTFDLPTDYTGNAIWGSTAAIDPKLGLLYVGTGNNYSVPKSVEDCQSAGGTNCVSPDDHVDSLLAMDLSTGKIKWATGTIEFDNWTVGCILAAKPNCPSPSSPDADFGSGPNLFRAGGQTLVGAGTKGGTYWTLDAATGKIVWSTQVGPGGIFGGIEWGSAVADGKVYVALSNSSHVSTTLSNPAPGSATTTTGGFWAALDAKTGAVLWQSADPAGPTFGDIGQVATANGVVYAGSSDATGHVFALDGKTGKIKWSFATGGSIASGASIVDGTVYWGSGYGQFATQPPPSATTGNNKVYAFSLPKEKGDD